jgi:hypothetical protein
LKTTLRAPVAQTLNDNILETIFNSEKDFIFIAHSAVTNGLPRKDRFLLKKRIGRIALLFGIWQPTVIY